jgi:hypothetical protein
MTENETRVAHLYERLGYRPLNRTWAKVEVLLGLLAAALGLLLGVWSLSRPSVEIPWGPAGVALALLVLGGYLALAGQRSHLYQSANELTAYLADLIRDHSDKGQRDAHPH